MSNDTQQVEIDFAAEMRDQLGTLMQMNDALRENAYVESITQDNFGQIHDMFARLLNVTTYLLDEHAKLTARVDAQNRLIQGMAEASATTRPQAPALRRWVVEYEDGLDCGLVARCNDGTEWVRVLGTWCENNPHSNPTIPQP